MSGLMRHSADKVVADLELLRDDALDDGLPTSAMWLTCAIETVNDLAARLADAEARAEALRSALERTQANFIAAVNGKPVRDMAENLAENREALRGDQ